MTNCSVTTARTTPSLALTSKTASWVTDSLKSAVRHHLLISWNCEVASGHDVHRGAGAFSGYLVIGESALVSLGVANGPFYRLGQ